MNKFIQFHKWLKEWKPIHLCWWFEKHNLPIPPYFIGKASASASTSASASKSLSPSASVSASISPSASPSNPWTIENYKHFDASNTNPGIISITEKIK